MIGITGLLKVKRTESSANIGEDRYHYLYDPLGCIVINEVHMVDALAVRGDERRRRMFTN